MSTDMESDLNNLKQALNSELTKRILPFHIENMRDPEGGFYGMITNDQTNVYVTVQ